jgi:hypothetical protein
MGIHREAYPELDEGRRVILCPGAHKGGEESLCCTF